MVSVHLAKLKHVMSLCFISAGMMFRSLFAVFRGNILQYTMYTIYDMCVLYLLCTYYYGTETMIYTRLNMMCDVRKS